jgi:hypothetical protein
LTEASLRRTDPAWRWTGPEIPKIKPAYKSLRVGLDGRIWVSVSTPAVKTADTTEVWQEPTSYDLFEANGTYLGRIGVPPRVRLSAMRGDRVWAAAFDADDVPTIRRYRIVWR